MTEIQAAEALLKALVIERRTMINASVQNPAGRNANAFIALQAEIEAVEAALSDEKRRRDQRQAVSAKQA